MILFDEASHTYTENGVIIPSVTQILSLAELYAKIDRGLLARAARFGQAVHKMTELWDKGQLNTDTLSVALKPYLDAWTRFLSDTGFEVLDCESIVQSKHGYCGTFDRLGMLDGKLTLVDIKTTTNIPKTTCLQLAAYVQAWEEMNPDRKIEQRVTVQLKPCAYYLKRFNNPMDFLTFLSFITVYKWRHDNG